MDRADRIYTMRFDRIDMHGGPTTGPLSHPSGHEKKSNSSVEEIVKRSSSKELKDEFEWRMEGEEKIEPLEVLKDIEDWALDTNSKSLLKSARQALISIDYYIEITDEEISRTVSTGKNWWFKLNGKKYVLRDVR